MLKQENLRKCCEMTKIYIAGHMGMVGGAIMRQLQARGETHIITRTHGELDLTDQSAVRAFMQAERPDVVILAAAKVGGILANSSYPADFIYENLMIEANVIHQAYAAGVTRHIAAWLVVHLSPRHAAANARGCAADRRSGADK